MPPAAAPTAVLSYQAWQSEYSGDPSIVGSTIYIQARPFTVIGIAPPGFYGDRISDRPPEFWVPLQTEPYLRGEASILHQPVAHWLYPIGRVRPGTSVGALQAKLSAALRQWIGEQSVLTANGGTALIPRQHVVLAPAGGGIQRLQKETGDGLRMLMILSSVVLLIACANIANLMLARATAHRADVALRMALGAGQARVIRQILTESVLLSCLGGLAGLGVAFAGCRTILALAFPDARYMPVDASPSLPVLGFAFLVTLAYRHPFRHSARMALVACPPRRCSARVNRSTRDRSSLPQKALVIFQVALSVVLLAAAILMTKSLAKLANQNFGVATANRYVLHFDPAGAGYNAARRAASLSPNRRSLLRASRRHQLQPVDVQPARRR